MGSGKKRKIRNIENVKGKIEDHEANTDLRKLKIKQQSISKSTLEKKKFFFLNEMKKLMITMDFFSNRNKLSKFPSSIYLLRDNFKKQKKTKKIIPFPTNKTKTRQEPFLKIRFPFLSFF